MRHCVPRRGSSRNLPQPASPKVQATTLRIQVFGYGVGVAERIAKGSQEPYFVRVLLVKDYRYGVIIGVESG